jgi:hypothetical protein
MQDIQTLALSGVYTSDSPAQPGLENIKLRPGMLLSAQKYGMNIKPLTVPVQVLAPAAAINAEKKDEMRRISGAVSTVQAITTGDTATEVRTVAAEAARRLAGMAMLYSTAIRDFIIMSLENNREWLPDNTVAEIVGDDESVRRVLANRGNILPNPRVQLHLALDLDNRPRMVRNMNSALQAIGGLVQFFPEVKEYVLPIIKREVGLLGVRMKSSPKPNPMELLQQREAARAQAQPAPATLPEVPPELSPEVAPAMGGMM